MGFVFGYDGFQCNTTQFKNIFMFRIFYFECLKNLLQPSKAVLKYTHWMVKREVAADVWGNLFFTMSHKETRASFLDV